jgi:hypothetical protein
MKSHRTPTVFHAFRETTLMEKLDLERTSVLLEDLLTFPFSNPAEMKYLYLTQNDGSCPCLVQSCRHWKLKRQFNRLCARARTNEPACVGGLVPASTF